MRIGRLFFASAVPFLLAACEAGADASLLLGPETDLSYSVVSADGTVTDADVEAAGQTAVDHVWLDPDFNLLASDVDSRANDAGLDLANLTQYEQDNLPSLLGYGETEWEDVVAMAQAEIIEMINAAPQLGLESYYEAAEDMLSRTSEDDGPEIAMDDPVDHEIDLVETGPVPVNAILMSGMGPCLALASGMPVGMWPNLTECQKAYAWMVVIGFSTGLTASSCAAGNWIGCVGTVVGVVSVYKAYQDARDHCKAS